MAVRVTPPAGKFELQCHRLQCSVTWECVAKQRAINGTRSAAGPDQIAATKRPIDQVALPIANYVFDGVLHDLGAGAFQQPSVELKASDGVLDARDGDVQALEVPVQSSEGEKAVRIGADLQFQ